MLRCGTGDHFLVKYLLTRNTQFWLFNLCNNWTIVNFTLFSLKSPEENILVLNISYLIPRRSSCSSPSNRSDKSLNKKNSTFLELHAKFIKMANVFQNNNIFLPQNHDSQFRQAKYPYRLHPANRNEHLPVMKYLLHSLNCKSTNQHHIIRLIKIFILISLVTIFLFLIGLSKRNFRLIFFTMGI